MLVSENGPCDVKYPQNETFKQGLEAQLSLGCWTPFSIYGTFDHTHKMAFAGAWGEGGLEFVYDLGKFSCSQAMKTNVFQLVALQPTES